MGALTLKLSENIIRIDDLVQKDDEIKESLENNVELIKSNKDSITNNNSTLTKIDNDLIDLRGENSDFQEHIQKLNDIVLNQRSNYLINHTYLFNLDFEKGFNFTPDIKKSLVYEIILENKFIKDSFIELNESILYKFDNMKTSYYILKETYEFLDENDNILNKFHFNILSKGFIYKNIHIFKNIYHHKIYKDIDYIKIKLYLERIDQNNAFEFDLKLSNLYQTNYICLKYLKYNVF